VKVALTVNGAAVEVEARTDEMLHTVLARELGLRSVRETCGIGVCGACTVLLDGAAVSGCLLLAVEAEGCEVVTVEGLGGDDPVQRAFEEAHAFQCGWCTPGLVLAVKALLAEAEAAPGEQEIREALAGNLCRCGSYSKIVDAVRRAHRD
jgi:aerobic-type carbon monoxide dehydrogenase small subunit (CoxS/CutS family)